MEKISCTSKLIAVSIVCFMSAKMGCLESSVIFIFVFYKTDKACIKSFFFKIIL